MIKEQIDLDKVRIRPVKRKNNKYNQKINNMLRNGDYLNDKFIDFRFVPIKKNKFKGELAYA